MVPHAALDLWNRVSRRQFVCWFDNWYRPRYIPHALETDMSLNVTAFALLQICDIPPFEGHPPFHDVWQKSAVIGDEVFYAGIRLTKGIKDLSGQFLTMEYNKCNFMTDRSFDRWSSNFSHILMFSSTTSVLSFCISACTLHTLGCKVLNGSPCPAQVAHTFLLQPHPYPNIVIMSLMQHTPKL